MTSHMIEPEPQTHIGELRPLVVCEGIEAPRGDVPGQPGGRARLTQQAPLRLFTELPDQRAETNSEVGAAA